MNDSPLQLTMRELRPLFTSRRTWVVTAVIIIVLGLSGPFDTFDTLSFGPRLIYWGVICATTFVTGSFASMYLSALMAGFLPNKFLRAGLSSAGGCLPVAGIIIGFNYLAFPQTNFSIADGLEILLYALVISISVSAVFAAFSSQNSTKNNTAETAAIIEPPKLVSRLKVQNRGDLVSLSVKDHYVEVTTSRGSELLLMRLRDAIAETNGVEGLQIHRSHWIALDAVSNTRRDGARYVVETNKGDLFPISRTFLSAARKQGLA